MLAKHIEKGDTIGVIAQSEPITKECEEEIKQAVKYMENQGVKVKFAKHVHENPTRIRRNGKTQSRRHKRNVQRQRNRRHILCNAEASTAMEYSTT